MLIIRMLIIALTTLPVANAAGFVPANIMTNVSMSVSQTSIGLDLNQIHLASIQAVWSGTLASGSLSLEVSNDVVLPSQSGNPAANVVNWTTYTGSATTVSGSGDFLYNLLDSGYRWIRLKYTSLSGTGTINASYSGKN